MERNMSKEQLRRKGPGLGGRCGAGSLPLGRARAGSGLCAGVGAPCPLRAKGPRFDRWPVLAERMPLSLGHALGRNGRAVPMLLPGLGGCRWPGWRAVGVPSAPVPGSCSAQPAEGATTATFASCPAVGVGTPREGAPGRWSAEPPRGAPGSSAPTPWPAPVSRRFLVPTMTLGNVGLCPHSTLTPPFCSRHPAQRPQGPALWRQQWAGRPPSPTPSGGPCPLRLCGHPQLGSGAASASGCCDSRPREPWVCTPLGDPAFQGTGPCRLCNWAFAAEFRARSACSGRGLVRARPALGLPFRVAEAAQTSLIIFVTSSRSVSKFAPPAFGVFSKKLSPNPGTRCPRISYKRRALCGARRQGQVFGPF